MKKKWQRFIRRLFCKHTHAYWFYPTDVWWKHSGGTAVRVDGLKITVCWQCGKILKIKNYKA